MSKTLTKEEKAEHFVLENKPCLSLNDLQKVWFDNDEQVQFGRWEGIPLYRKFQNIAKQKLKQ